MSSKEVILGENLPKSSDNTSFSSEAVSYDDDSYGSEFQPPDLAHGSVMVHENRCRARYRKSRSALDAQYLICLNNSDCRSLAGGRHSLLRSSQRADPGVYEGVYGANRKLLAAKAGTCHTPQTLSRLASEARNSNRSQAADIGELSSDVAQNKPGVVSEGRASSRHQVTDQEEVPPSDVSPFTISEAEKLLTPDCD